MNKIKVVGAVNMSRKVEIEVSDALNLYRRREALGGAVFLDKDGGERLAQIEQDLDAQSPRTWESALWTWSTTDGAGYSDPGAMSIEDIEGYQATDEDTAGTMTKAFLRDYLVVPLYLYRHSGDVISAGEPSGWPLNDWWDSACMGYAYLEKAKALREYHWRKITPTREKILRDVLAGEVREMNAWLSGSTYYVEVTDLATGETDSCGGYICTDQRAMREVVRDYVTPYAGEGSVDEIVDAVLAWAA